MKLNNISSHFFSVIMKFIKKEYSILEFGSSTGHMSFILAQNGYKISLLDIREKPIKEAMEYFKKRNVNASFYVEDVKNHNNHYDFLFNSGLIQCLPDSEKEELISHIYNIADRILLFYPVRDVSIYLNNNEIAGVSGCNEYRTNNIHPIVYSFYKNIEEGEIPKNINESSLDFKWIFASG